MKKEFRLGEIAGYALAMSRAHYFGQESAANEGPRNPTSNDRQDIASAYGCEDWDLIPSEHRADLRHEFWRGHDSVTNNPYCTFRFVSHDHWKSDVYNVDVCATRTASWSVHRLDGGRLINGTFSRHIDAINAFMEIRS